MPPALNIAAQKSPPSRLDLLREALTRPDQALKPQQPSQVTEFYPAQTESEKTCSETGDDPGDENQEDGNWETDSLGAYEASGPSTGAHKKWDDLNLPAILERRLRRLETLLDKQISWNNEIQRNLTELREEPPTAEPAPKKSTRAKRPRTSGTD
ncbi:hypothetical protein ASPSYDRAFT_95833 [Aspergillus sydowii CBS 593.65]|uniref:Uncharacterized protein n=1 Tax=Aspergillus sydowii CBS 593.65 TaxID=1036612 RepID=A0A1L9SY64_9EURO|nr:uncharacterized protein ASPSYDRAFT_95833 [Aspergillus sydowii CBS 593.65]OJJ52128.1 hypothetical protein ASPSYDRAFT_95833 [Aspergillus sydowii CBS 593.65]